MPKAFIGAIAATLLFAAAPAFAQGAACDRSDLQGMADAYIDAQTTGVPLKIPFADFSQITEQGEIGSMSGGILSTPLKIDLHRAILDVPTCSAFVEVIVTDPAHPYVIGARLQYAGKFSPIAAERTSEAEFVVTDKDDWLFNAKKTLQYAKAENWGEIPAADRDSGATLIAAANAYLDSFSDKSVQVPWATPCARLEGGLYTNEGRCDVGIPSGVKLTERRYIVDETIGAVAVVLRFGDNQLPDVHSFRVEKGKIRYVHTMTVCKSENCGLKLPDDVKRRLQD
jgi:hypothetical protein